MWDLLAEEAKSKAEANPAAGAALATRTLNAAKEKLSARQLKTNKREGAIKMENEAARLRAGADALSAAALLSE